MVALIEETVFKLSSTENPTLYGQVELPTLTMIRRLVVVKMSNPEYYLT